MKGRPAVPHMQPDNENMENSLSDRVSYLKGLAEGLKLDTDKNEGKLIEKMLELLADMADELSELRQAQDETNEYVDSIDRDLSELEDIIYDEDDEDCSGDCANCEKKDECEDSDEDDGIVEYTCPHCGEEMTFEVESFDFDEDYLCPSCHKPLFPETPDEEDEEEEENDKK